MLLGKLEAERRSAKATATSAQLYNMVCKRFMASYIAQILPVFGEILVVQSRQEEADLGFDDGEERGRCRGRSRGRRLRSCTSAALALPADRRRRPVLVPSTIPAAGSSLVAIAQARRRRAHDSATAPHALGSLLLLSQRRCLLLLLLLLRAARQDIVEHRGRSGFNGAARPAQTDIEPRNAATGEWAAPAPCAALPVFVRFRKSARASQSKVTMRKLLAKALIASCLTSSLRRSYRTVCSLLRLASRRRCVLIMLH